VRAELVILQSERQAPESQFPTPSTLEEEVSMWVRRASCATRLPAVSPVKIRRNSILRRATETRVRACSSAQWQCQPEGGSVYTTRARLCAIRRLYPDRRPDPEGRMGGAAYGEPPGNAPRSLTYPDASQNADLAWSRADMNQSYADSPRRSTLDRSWS